MNTKRSPKSEPPRALEPVTTKVRGQRYKRALPPRFDRDMSQAWKNGAGLVLLAPGGREQVEAYWRSTRSFDPKTGRYTDNSFWARRGSNVRVDFNPVAWRPPYEYQELVGIVPIRRPERPTSDPRMATI